MSQHDWSEHVNCPVCESINIDRKVTKHNFSYGTDDKTANITTDLPVNHCLDCGAQFLTSDAEDLMHAAVCRHLGVLNPNEIVALRTKYNLSRSEFASISRIGEATLGRWERGELIQNAGYDQLLRLLSYPENLARAKRDSADAVSPGAVGQLGKFKSLRRIQSVELSAAKFQLRLAGAA